MGKILESVGNAVLKGATGGIAGGVTSLVGGLFGGNSAEKQHQKELEKMGLQAKYNREQAAYNQQLALEMWDKTNYKAQVEQLIKAGLNPALLYGQGGTGGTTQGAGAAEGVSMGTSMAVGMGLQEQQTRANLALTASQAELNEAQANKIEGIDTKEAESRISLNESIKAMNEYTNQLKSAQKLNLEELTKNISVERDKLIQSLRKEIAEADITEETKDMKIDQVFHENQRLMMEGIKNYTQGRLNEKELKLIEQQIKYYSYNAYSDRLRANAAGKQAAASETVAEATKYNSETNRMSAETFAKKVTEEVRQRDKELSQEDTRILQNWIFGGVKAGAQIIDSGLDIYTKGATKALKDDKKPTSSWEEYARQKEDKLSNGRNGLREYQDDLIRRAEKGDEDAKELIKWKKDKGLWLD